jgi:hypothetical protein
VTVSGTTTGIDPDFRIYQGRLVARGETVGPSTETMNISLAAGEHVLVVNDRNNSPGPSCFTALIN